jgi:beta-lysine 5,6-aminomutase alpha subunit
LPNVLVDHVQERGGLGRGIAYWLGSAMLQTGRSPQEIAEAVSAGELDLSELGLADERAIRDRVTEECAARLKEISGRFEERRAMRERLGDNPAPLRYVLTATGDVYEDVVHARAVAEAGGDIVAVIRSTAQSLLDYVPYGPTTEGYGGTFATQANFRIMREAMDEWSEQHGRYIRLSSFCSGLCMSEIASMGAWEGFDNMVNDALYGILYRDINIVRGLIDQRVSRMINGYFGVVINTGEDNYLRTADALQAAPSVTASQFINHQLAHESGVPDGQIALGDAFEIDVPVRNGLLYEWAQAQLTRELFPDCPVKYMPPTRHMDGNLFRTHASDTLFNLVTIATGQGVQTIGVPTEGIFTPHIHDRVLGLQNVDYVFNTAHDLGEEIEFKRGGIIQTRAQEVLAGAHELLEGIAQTGLFKAIEQATFGDVSRRIDEGRGIEGIVTTEDGYHNPVVELMRDPAVADEASYA